VINPVNPIPSGECYERACADAWSNRLASAFELDEVLAHEAAAIPSLTGDAESVALDRELIATLGYPEFVRRAWPHIPVVGANTYVPGRVVHEICRHLEAWFWGSFDDLLINQPPGTGKSALVSILWPAWVWTIDPKFRFIYGAYKPALALEHAERAYDLISSPWYTERWGELFPRGRRGETVRQAMGYYENVHGGTRFSTSVEGGVTGTHANARVFDDPIKPMSLETQHVEAAALEKCRTWWTGTMSSRRIPGKRFLSGGVMQRLHMFDLSEHCIEEGYEHLRLPLRFEPESKCVTKIGGDWRTAEDDPLYPELIGPEEMKSKIVAMLGKDSMLDAAQNQQRPVPKGGALFKQEQFQPFLLVADRARPGVHVCRFEDTVSILSVDCAFKDTATSDYVAIEVWGTTGGRFYCFDSRLEHWDLNATIDAVLATLRDWPATLVVVEEKANGAEVIKALEASNIIVEPYLPKDSKESRAQVASTFYKNKAVYHLDAAWRERKEANLKLFPRGRHDDDVDATSQALIKLQSLGLADFLAAMRAGM
jgi:predicted phage terminase large subunit-like protein